MVKSRTKLSRNTRLPKRNRQSSRQFLYHPVRGAVGSSRPLPDGLHAGEAERLGGGICRDPLRAFERQDARVRLPFCRVFVGGDEDPGGNGRSLRFQRRVGDRGGRRAVEPDDARSRVVAQGFGPECHQCFGKTDLVHLLEVHKGIGGQLGEDGLREVERGFQNLAHAESRLAQRGQSGAPFRQRDGLERGAVVECLLADGPDAGTDHDIG